MRQIIIAFVAYLMVTPFIYAQVKLSTEKDPIALIASDVIEVDYKDTIVNVDVLSNIDYTIQTNSNWVKALINKSNLNSLYFTVSQNMSNARTATILLEDKEGKRRGSFQIVQKQDNSAEYIKGDKKILAYSGQASSFHSGEGIEKSFDGDMSTIYHSDWNNSATNYFPITLVYNFKDVEQIDYLVYHPRQSGYNGHFKVVDIYYNTTEDPTYVFAKMVDMGGGSNATQVDFTTPIMNPKSIKFVVKSGNGDGQGFASCAEMEFYRIEKNSDDYSIFGDDLWTTLKPGTTMDEIQNTQNLFVKRLASAIYEGNYSTEFRVAEFEAYPPLSETSSWMKTSSYNSFENPTGIYFNKDESIVLLVKMPEGVKASLIIQNFGTEDAAGSSYSLKNGINKITASNRGLGYISYFTSDYETAPKIKIHFVMGKENGYFDRGRHTNEDWKRMLANACSDIMDVRGYYSQIAYPTASFRSKAPEDGVRVAETYDSIVYYEHEIMGLHRYNKVPKNRQFSRVVGSGMFADGIGAGIPVNGVGGYISRDDMDFWGIAHELGHVNQIRPGLKWVSITEVSNNIYSAWVQFMLGNRQNLRLEHESHGSSDDNRNGIGGRFNSYLNYGIRMGNKWLMQEGPDYFGSALASGKRNYDHFVKLCPLWQIQLYCQQAGYSPDIYAMVSEKVRKTNESGLSNGQLQLNFMRNVCDSTQQDFTDFFIKVGMLREYKNVYLEDYSPGYMNITQEQCDELVNYAKKYPKPASPVIYYISGNNWKIFKDKLPLEGSSVGNGVSASGTKMRVSHSLWKNVVAFESYKGDEMTGITMAGAGCKDFSFTDVIYPEGSTRIEAVDWQGNRTLVYGSR